MCIKRVLVMSNNSIFEHNAIVTELVNHVRCWCWFAWWILSDAQWNKIWISVALWLVLCGWLEPIERWHCGLVGCSAPTGHELWLLSWYQVSSIFFGVVNILYSDWLYKDVVLTKRVMLSYMPFICFVDCRIKRLVLIDFVMLISFQCYLKWVSCT